MGNFRWTVVFEIRTASGSSFMSTSPNQFSKIIAVEKSAHCSRRVRGADLLCRRNRICVHRALRPQLYPRFASRRAIRPHRTSARSGPSLFPDDDRRLERMATGRRLVRSGPGNYNFSDSTRAERRVVSDFLRNARPGLALIEIIFLWAAVLACIILFWRISIFSAALLLPYLAWITYATYLNAEIWRLNPAHSRS